MNYRMKEELYPIPDFPFLIVPEYGKHLAPHPVFYHALQFLWVQEGRAEVQAGLSLYSLSPGDVLYIPEDTATVLQGSPDLRLTRTVFRPDLYLSELSEFERGIVTIRNIRNRYQATLYRSGSPVTEQILSALHRMQVEWDVRDVCFRLLIKGAAYQMVATILRHYVESQYLYDRTTYKNLLRLRPVMAYVEEKLNGRIYVKNLSDLLALSEDHFEKLFRTATGMSPMEYVTYARLNRALCHLAATSDKPCTVAKACGFSSTAYFLRVLEETLSHTPEDYRAGVLTIRRQPELPPVEAIDTLQESFL